MPNKIRIEDNLEKIGNIVKEGNRKRGTSR
jgi:hypothetical protein